MIIQHKNKGNTQPVVVKKEVKKVKSAPKVTKPVEEKPVEPKEVEQM